MHIFWDDTPLSTVASLLAHQLQDVSCQGHENGSKETRCRWRQVLGVWASHRRWSMELSSCRVSCYAPYAYSSFSSSLFQIWCLQVLFWLCMSLVVQLCLTLYHPMVCSSPGFSVHGICQARILEWVAIFSSTRSFRSRDRTRITSISCIAGRFFTCWDILAQPSSPIESLQTRDLSPTHWFPWFGPSVARKKALW